MAKSNKDTSKKKSAVHAADDALNAAQVLFTANPGFQPPGMRFLVAQGPIQENLRDEAEKFSSAWFKRREDAGRALLETAVRMSTEGLRNPVAAMKIMMDWQVGAMERVAEDARDCTQMMTRCAETLIDQEIEAVDDMAKGTETFENPHQSTPV